MNKWIENNSTQEEAAQRLEAEKARCEAMRLKDAVAQEDYIRFKQNMAGPPTIESLQQQIAIKDAKIRELKAMLNAVINE